MNKSRRVSFNPTLVRLKPKNEDAWTWNLSSFNPTLVRLKPSRTTRFASWTGSFNPTLVRLKPCLVFTNHVIAKMFQSHFGSIKTQSTGDRKSPEDKFQSHFGSIKTFSDVAHKLTDY